ncbi:MAG: D-alanyl-D-alanine carboxypeptidase [Hyphomonadaceae bacterium]|nr:D-alanyl-D-alanine carboxypeptidase [Hyphomonadaceae bacterium]
MVRFVFLFLAAALFLRGPLALAQGIDSEASHAVIMDYATGEVLWDKNGEEAMIPASMTKMMTAHLVFDRLRAGELSLTDQFTVSENAWRKGGWASGGSTMGLAVGDQPTVEELLRGVIILSGNDACIVLAEGISGTEEAFAREMTATAQRMGLTTASFRNATGLDEEGHRISAADLARLARLTIQDFPDYYAFYSEEAYEWRGIRQPNRNPLLGRTEGVDGLKTGHLEISGYGLTASAKRGEDRRIIVINGMASEGDRGREAERLMRLAFSAFETRTLTADNLVLPVLPVWMGERETVEVELADPLVLSGMKRAFADATVEIVYQGPLEAPVGAGDTVASLVITRPGEDTVSAPLIARESIARTGFFGRVLDGLNRLISGGETS